MNLQASFPLLAGPLNITPASFKIERLLGIEVLVWRAWKSTLSKLLH